MCCFSGPVEDVSNTKIFARLDGARQALVYQMQFQAAAELAMVLPLPTAEGAGEDALEWVNLEGYPEFFADLFQGFPQPLTRSRNDGRKAQKGELAVVEVGSFEASFVPRVADFERLDERFRLPADTWEKLPQYADWGFAVFKLKPDHSSVHPMAFWFPSRGDRQLFFPTVHIHDGEVHETARFDHTLYCQLPADATAPGEFAASWRESAGPANGFMKLPKCRGLLAGDEHCHMRALRGELENADTLVTLM